MLDEIEENDDLKGETARLLTAMPCFQPLRHDHFELAPCEGMVPVGIFSEAHLEEMCFPDLFNGLPFDPPKHGRNVTKKAMIKWQLTHEDRRFAQHTENLFFKYYCWLTIQVSSAISIRGQQSLLQNVNARDVQSSAVFRSFFRSDALYNEFKLIRHTPHYWDNVKKDLFAVIRQNKCPPTFFLSLSMAESKWEPLLKCLLEMKLQRSITEEEIHKLTSKQRHRLIESDPAIVSRYFNKRRRHFIQHVLKEGCVLGDVTDYFGVIEFQQRGTPHLHMLLWVNDAPTNDESTTPSMESVVAYVEKYVHVSNGLQIAKDRQQHKHTFPCRQPAKKGKCSFGFPKPPLWKTMILSPI